MFEKIVVADIADEDQKIHVFKGDLDCVDPILVDVETKDYVSWIEENTYQGVDHYKEEGGESVWSGYPVSFYVEDQNYY